MDFDYYSELESLRDDNNALREKLHMSGLIGQELLSRLEKTMKENDELKEITWRHDKEVIYYEETILKLNAEISRLREENVDMTYYDDDDSDQESCFSTPVSVYCGTPNGTSVEMPKIFSSNQLKSTSSMFSTQLLTLHSQLEEIKLANANLQDKFNESCLEREALLRKLEERDKEIDLFRNNFRTGINHMIETNSNLLHGISQRTHERSYSQNDESIDSMQCNHSTVDDPETPYQYSEHSTTMSSPTTPAPLSRTSSYIYSMKTAVNAAEAFHSDEETLKLKEELAFSTERLKDYEKTITCLKVSI